MSDPVFTMKISTFRVHRPQSLQSENDRFKVTHTGQVEWQAGVWVRVKCDVKHFVSSDTQMTCDLCKYIQNVPSFHCGG